MSNYNIEQVRYTVERCNYALEGSEIVKVIMQGKNHAETIYTKKKPKQGVIKLSKEEYMIIRTGEVKKYKLTSKKQDESLRKTFTRLTQLIRTNFKSKSKKQLFLTLTYKENMQDRKKLMDDFNKFIKRLKYNYKNKYKFEYIAVAEPQERGAWHFHVTLKTITNNNLYIDNEDLEKIWGHGFTEAQRLKSDDIGKYYVAYFTQLSKDKKGSRLHFYPKNFKFYRTSKGIKKPETKYMTWSNVKKIYGNPTWEQSYNLIRKKENEKEVANTINKAYFNKERGKEN